MIHRKDKSKILTRCKAIGFRRKSNFGYMTYMNNYGEAGIYRYGVVMIIDKRKSLKEPRYQALGFICAHKLKTAPSRKQKVYDMTNYFYVPNHERK